MAKRIELNDPIILEYLNNKDWLANNGITIGPSSGDATKSYSFDTHEFSEPTKGGNVYLLNGEVLDPYTLVGMVLREEDNKRWNEENSKSILNKLHMSANPDLFGNTRVSLVQRDHNSPYYKAMMEGLNMAGNLAISVATLPWTVSGLGSIGNLIKAGEWGSLIGGTAGAIGLTKATDAAVGAITNNQYTSLYDYLTANGFSGYNAGLGYVPILSGAMSTAGKILETDLAGNLSKVNRFAENIASKTTPETVTALERPRTVFTAPAPEIKVLDVIAFKGNKMSPGNMREAIAVTMGEDPLAPTVTLTSKPDKPYFKYLGTQNTQNLTEELISLLAEATRGALPERTVVTTSLDPTNNKIAKLAFGNEEDFAAKVDKRGWTTYRKKPEWEKRIIARNSTPWEPSDISYEEDLWSAKKLADDVISFSKRRSKSEAINLIKLRFPYLSDEEVVNLYTLVKNAPPESVARHIGLHPLIVENERLNTARLLHNSSSPFDPNNLAAYGLPEPRMVGGNIAPINIDSRGNLKGSYTAYATRTPNGGYAIQYVDTTAPMSHNANGELIYPVGDPANTAIYVDPTAHKLFPALRPQMYFNPSTGKFESSKIGNNIFLPWFRQLLSASRQPGFKGFTIGNDSLPHPFDFTKLWRLPIEGDVFDHAVGYKVKDMAVNGLSTDSNRLFPELAKRMYGDEAKLHLFLSPALVDYNEAAYDNARVSKAIQNATTPDEMKKAINDLLNPYLKEIGLSPSIYNEFMSKQPIGTVPFIVLKKGGKLIKNLNNYAKYDF